MTSIKYSSFQEFGYESELAQLTKVNCPIINTIGLPHITKINHNVNSIEKLLPIMGYVDEAFF